MKPRSFKRPILILTLLVSLSLALSGCDYEDAVDELLSSGEDIDLDSLEDLGIDVDSNTVSDLINQYLGDDDSESESDEADSDSTSSSTDSGSSSSSSTDSDSTSSGSTSSSTSSSSTDTSTYENTDVYVEGEITTQDDYTESDDSSFSVASIDVLTEVVDSSTVVRTLVFHVRSTTMDSKAKTVNSFFKNLTPKRASLTTSTTDTETLFTITSKELDISSLEDYDASIFGEATVSISTLDSSAFTVAKGLVETFSVANFCTEGNTVYVYSYIREGDNVCAYYDADTVSYTPLSEDDYLASDDTYSGYYYTWASACGHDDYATAELSVLRYYSLASVDITCSPDKTGEVWSRTLVFTFDETPSSDEQTAILSALNSRITGYGDVTTITAKSSLLSKTYKVTIEQEGSFSDVNASMQALCDNADCGVDFELETKFFKKTFAMVDYLDLSNLVPSVSLSDDYSFTYTLTLGSKLTLDDSELITNSSADSELLTIEKATLSFSSDNTSYYLNAAGSYRNMATFIWIIISGVIVVAGVIIANIIMIKKIKKSRAEEEEDNGNASNDDPTSQATSRTAPPSP